MKALTKQQIDDLVNNAQSLCTTGKSDVRKIMYAQNGIAVETRKPKNGEIWKDRTLGIFYIIARVNPNHDLQAIGLNDGNRYRDLASSRGEVLDVNFDFVADTFEAWMRIR